MTRLPVINKRHKICIICEGFEEYYYITRLLNLNVWSDNYEFIIINAKSASNIFPRYQDAYNNARYEIILILCDTDKKPYREYSQIKSKINKYHNNKSASNKVIIFANPCTMLIILSHFAEVILKTQAKKANAPLIYQLTGVENYDAKEEQIKSICRKIYKRTYPNMKERITKFDKLDIECCSTNFIKFIDYFEKDNYKWIKDINDSLEKND